MSKTIILAIDVTITLIVIPPVRQIKNIFSSLKLEDIS